MCVPVLTQMPNHKKQCFWGWALKWSFWEWVWDWKWTRTLSPQWTKRIWMSFVEYPLVWWRQHSGWSRAWDELLLNRDKVQDEQRVRVWLPWLDHTRSCKAFQQFPDFDENLGDWFEWAMTNLCRLDLEASWDLNDRWVSPLTMMSCLRALIATWLAGKIWNMTATHWCGRLNDGKNLEILNGTRNLVEGMTQPNHTWFFWDWCLRWPWSWVSKEPWYIEVPELAVRGLLDSLLLRWFFLSLTGFCHRSRQWSWMLTGCRHELRIWPAEMMTLNMIWKNQTWRTLMILMIVKKRRALRWWLDSWRLQQWVSSHEWWLCLWWRWRTWHLRPWCLHHWHWQGSLTSPWSGCEEQIMEEQLVPPLLYQGVLPSSPSFWHSWGGEGPMP